MRSVSQSRLGGEWGRGWRSEAGAVPDLKVNVGLVGCKAGCAQACHTDTLFQEAASGGHEAGQRQGDAQKWGGSMPLVSEYACEQRRLALAQRDHHPLGPWGRYSLSREHSSTASTAGPVSSFPPRWSRLMAVFSSCCRSLRCWGPKPGVGRAGQKHRGHHLVARGKERSSGSGPLTRGRWCVEIGRKAVDVAADRDTLISDPKGTEHRHRAVGQRGCPRQGPCWAWGYHSVRQGLSLRSLKACLPRLSPVLGTQPHVL